MPDVEFALPTNWMVLVMGGMAGLLVLFALLAHLRSWGMRLQKEGGACGGLDLECLKRQCEAGDIRPDEYEAICARLTTAPSARPAGKTASQGLGEAGSGGAPSERSINDTGGEPERSSTDG